MDKDDEKDHNMAQTFPNSPSSYLRVARHYGSSLRIIEAMDLSVIAELKKRCLHCDAYLFAEGPFDDLKAKRPSRVFMKPEFPEEQEIQYKVLCLDCGGSWTVGVSWTVNDKDDAITSFDVKSKPQVAVASW